MRDEILSEGGSRDAADAGTVCVAKIVGDVDVQTLGRVRALLAELAGAGRSVIDLLAHRRREEDGGDTVRLVVPKDSQIARIVELTGLDRVLRIFETLEGASGQ